MAAKDERRIVSLGGKGQSLSSSSAFEVADGVARLIIDSSALSRLSDDTQQKFTFTVPDYLTNEESRASILLLLSKCLLSHKSASVSAVNQLSDILNNPDKAYAGSHSINVKDVTLFDYSAVALDAISVILDFSSSALSAIADAVAAMSCEALKADVATFNLIDSGDGSTSKDDVSVASDFKVFFNQSKLGKFVDPSISKIPSVHGNFRENSRLLHSRARVELNSGFNGASDKAMSNALSSLAHALCELGEISSRRSKLLFELIPANELLSSIMKSENYSPGESAPLDDLYIASQVTLRKEKDYIKFAHQIYSLSELVRKTICWEALLAFFLLEGGFNKVSIVPNVEETGKPAKKSEKANAEKTGKSAKKSEKKSVMGKGTGAFVQFIKDKLSSAEVAEDDWMRSFISFFDPKFLGFESLMSKVKEIVESNESRRLPKLPKGTRDFAKEQMAIREHAFSIITNVFKRHGATSLDTPVFEMRETLMGKYGEDSKLIYDLADQGGELCSLRYDLTVPFARFVAMNGITSLKRYQIAKVYRRDNPSKGRYREFYQCDFDIAGLSENMGPDFEVIRVLTELLDELNIGDYKVKLNHRKLLDGMLAICGVPQEKFRTICSSIDKLDKQPFDKIKKEMVNEKGLTEEIADKIGMFVKESGPPIELLNKLKQEGSEFNKNSESKLALEELEVLFNTLVKSKCINKVVFDLSLARGLDYYTGVIFEAVFKGDTQVGSIAAGGRYDNLIGMFGTKQVPSVGISLGIERVFAIMEQQEKNQEIRATETQVLVSILSKDDDKALGLSLGAEIVSELWDAKLKAEYLVNGRWTKHTDRAKNSKIPWIVRVDESLISQGKVQLKNVIATEEKDILVERDTLVEELKRRLN